MFGALLRGPPASGFGVRVLVGAKTGEGVEPIGDVGGLDWVAKLTSNARHRFVAAGFGLQLVPLVNACD